MFIRSFPTEKMYAMNCYVIAPTTGKEYNPAIIVDTGQNCFDTLKNLVKENNLTPEAILLTHGHFDHTWECEKVGNHFKIPTYIHPLDRPQLSDPAVGLSPDPSTPLNPGLAALINGLDFKEPEKVIDLNPTDDFEIAGIKFQVKHAPGHSLGSLCYIFNATSDHNSKYDGEIAIVGDVLFKDGIGRTDLQGGNVKTLLESIQNELMVLDDETLVFPGHGESTNIGRERKHNPFLTQQFH